MKLYKPFKLLESPTVYIATNKKVNIYNCHFYYHGDEGVRVFHDYEIRLEGQKYNLFSKDNTNFVINDNEILEFIIKDVFTSRKWVK